MIHKCINIDSIRWLQDYDDPKFADLVFADPPFNIGWEYDTIHDKLPDTDFLNWLRTWVSLCIDKVMKPNSQIVICMGDEYVSDLDVLCRKELKLYRQNWLIWHYGFGQSGKLDSRKRFTRSKTHLLRYSLHKSKFTFNGGDIAIPSDRLKKYADNRADPRGKCPDDVLIFNRIAGTHKSRVKGISTQMPVEMVSKLVKAFTNPNDCVYDPFPGSGVVLKSCIGTGRGCVATEISKAYYDLTMEWLSSR